MARLNDLTIVEFVVFALPESRETDYLTPGCVREARVRGHIVVLKDAMPIAGVQLFRVELAHIKRCAYAAEVHPVQERYRAPLHVQQLGNTLDHRTSNTVTMSDAKS